MIESFRDLRRRPLILYDLTLVIVLGAIVAHWKWFAVFHDHVGERFPRVFAVPVYAGWVILSTHPAAVAIISSAFIVAMLAWPDAGVLVVSLYLLSKTLFYLVVLGFTLSVSALGDSVGIPSYLAAWEVITWVVMVAYLVKKDALIRAAKRGRYQLVGLGDRQISFDKETGERVSDNDWSLRYIGGDGGVQQSTVGVDGAVATASGAVDISLEYEIQDGPEGRLFLVKDRKTGECQLYQSLDEMPPFHCEVFVRMLRDAP